MVNWVAGISLGPNSLALADAGVCRGAAGASGHARMPGLNLPRFVAGLFMAVAFGIPAHSALPKPDDYITCALAYGALLQAAKDSGNSAMLSYASVRLQAVLPFVEKNKGNPELSDRLKIIANQLEVEGKGMARRATEAIIESDVAKLKAALPPVFRCDAVFGIQSLPLPLPKARALKSKFAEGFYSGCLANQRRNPGPYREGQLLNYCMCVTEKSVERGMTAASKSDEIAAIIKMTHPICVSQIPP